MSDRRIEVEEVGGATVVTFVDKRILDEQNIQLIGEQLFSLVEDQNRDKIVLDFENVEYLSSAALGKLITLNKKVKAVDGQLRLCSIKKDIREVFMITRLDKVFPIDDDVDDSLDSLS